MESKQAEASDALHAYVEELAFGRDAALRAVEDSTAALGGIAVMQTGVAQTAFLELLTRLTGAQRALEVGTFTGYGAIRIARGLAPGGTLTCLELDERWAQVARENIDAAGVGERVEIVVGPALESLRAMPEEPTFGFAYLDADKDGYPAYYEEIVARLRPGGLLGMDNVLRGGRVVSPEEDTVRITAEFNAHVAADERVESVLLPLDDGLTLARRL